MEGGSGERGRRTSPGAKGALPVQPAVLLTDAQSPQLGFDLSDFLIKLSPPLQFTLIFSIYFTLFLLLLFSG